MNIPLTSWIATRYLGSRSAGRFAPLLRFTAIAGVALGTTALIVVMSVMLGFRKELAKRLVGFDAHVTLARGAEAAELEADDVARLTMDMGVTDISPFVQGEVIARSASGGAGQLQGARVRGVDPERMGSLGEVEVYRPERIRDIDLLDVTANLDLPEAILGNEVVANLMVHPDFADAIELTAPLAEVGPAGDLVPSSRRFRVAGVFRAGIYEYDNKYILVGLDDARTLLGEQASEGWHLWLDDLTRAPAVVSELSNVLPEGWRAEGFDEHNKKLFAALKLERAAMGAILVMVLVIASCSIAGVVLLITAAKRKDIAILRTVGMNEGGIRRIFVAHAAIIGLIGSAVGLALGVGVSLAADAWPIRLPDSYYLDYLPVDLSAGMSVLFALSGVAVAVVASLYPVAQAARQSPVEVLRYE